VTQVRIRDEKNDAFEFKLKGLVDEWVDGCGEAWRRVVHGSTDPLDPVNATSTYRAAESLASRQVAHPLASEGYDLQKHP
jgi:hypothetical protein